MVIRFHDNTLQVFTTQNVVFVALNTFIDTV